MACVTSNCLKERVRPRSNKTYGILRCLNGIETSGERSKIFESFSETQNGVVTTSLKITQKRKRAAKI